MLHDTRRRAGLALRVKIRLWGLLRRPRYADLDLRAMSPYLRRDLGLGDPCMGRPDPTLPRWK